MRTIIGILAVAAHAGDLDILLDEAKKLNTADVQKLEGRFDDAEAHLKLAAYYTEKKSVGARGRHILWLIEKQPQHAAFLRGEFRVFAEGPLADPAGFEKGKTLWLAHRESNDKAIIVNAANWLSLGDPAAAEHFYRKAQDGSGLGSLYANALLGLTALAPDGYRLVAANASRRSTAFGKKALAAIQSNHQREFVSAAAKALGHNGETLYALGFTDWDYTPVLKPLLARALRLDPDNFDLYAVSLSLPARGDVPVRIIRLADPRISHQVAPEYPEAAKRKRVQGVVRFEVLIGKKGEVLRLRLVSGPQELVKAAHDAVTQWRYMPLRLFGKPVFVITHVSVPITLSSVTLPRA